MQIKNKKYSYARLLVSSGDLVPGVVHSTAIAQERGVVIALMSHYPPIAYRNQLEIKFTEIHSTSDSLSSERFKFDRVSVAPGSAQGP